MEIQGSNILITGGNSGIGKETAKQLIALGANAVSVVVYEGLRKLNKG